MATVLEGLTTEEQPSVVRFFVGKRTEGEGYSQTNVPVYGGKCLLHKTVHN
jgi:hypothetical protein